MTYFTSTTHTTFAPLEGFEAPMLMRRATAADAARIRVLARLDDKRLPSGPFLVAEVTGEVVAAISLPSGTVVADPFRPTGDAVAMLRLRSAQVRTDDELTARRERGSGGSFATAVAA
jgi:hypothetical protein